MKKKSLYCILIITLLTLIYLFLLQDNSQKKQITDFPNIVPKKNSPKEPSFHRKVIDSVAKTNIVKDNLKIVKEPVKSLINTQKKTIKKSTVNDSSHINTQKNTLVDSAQISNKDSIETTHLESIANNSLASIQIDTNKIVIEQEQLNQETLKQAFIKTLYSKINSAKQYPKISKKLKQEGVVIITFSVNRKGDIFSVIVKKPSIYPLLNRATIDAVNTVSGKEPIPEKLHLDIIDFELPISYKLKSN